MSARFCVPFRRAHLSVFATVLSLSLGLGLAPGLAVQEAGAAEPTSTTVKTGVYRGSSGGGAAKIPAYETLVGRPVDYALDFQANDTVSNQEWPDWQANAWRGRTVVLGSTGIFPGSYDRMFNGTRVGWAQAARGDYDASWQRLGQRLVATGQSQAVLRGAHEFNGGWFAHRVHPEEAADFVLAWRRWVTIMRAVPGQAFTFDWNPTVGSEWPLFKPEVAYPGDAYVDHIALDVYDGWYNRGWSPGGTQPTTAERDAVWHSTVEGERGLRFWRDFSAAHGKKLSLPEWGIRVWTESDGLVHGGGDNASFVQRMAGLIKDPAWRIDYHAFWEDPGRGISDADAGRSVAVPAARAAYLAAFGTAAPVQPSPTAAPVVGLDCSRGTRQVTASQLPLLYSPWSDRSWGAELTGRSVSGNIFAWVPSSLSTTNALTLTKSRLRARPIQRAAFRAASTLQSSVATDVQRVGMRLDAGTTRVDGAAPFDLVEGNIWWAEPLKTGTLSKGKHRVLVTVQRADGCLQRSVTFTVV